MPIIIKNNNFSKGEPTLLSFDAARTLFHAFGHNAERRIMPHGLIDGRQRLTSHAAGSA